MDASLNHRRAWKASGAALPLRLVVHTVAWTTLGLAALLGLLVLGRRAMGGLIEPLPPLAMIFAAGVLAAAALGFRRLMVFPLAGLPTGRSPARWLSAAVSLVLLCWAAALAVDGSGGGMLCLWGILIVEEGWSWELLRLAGPSASAVERIAPKLQPARAQSQLTSPLESLPAEPDEARDTELVQQLTRRRLDDGRDVLEGWQRVELAAGQRHASAHVAICPPLAHLPVCYVEQTAGPEAQVKVAQVLVHGVRIEVKLDRAWPEPQTVELEFSIQPSAADGEREEPATE